MENLSFEEKRAFPRFPVSIPVSCYCQNNTERIITQTQDISAIGLCIITDQELSAGSSLEVCIEMPDNGERIRRKALVVWSKVTHSLKYRIGIKLTDKSIKPVNIVLRILNLQRN